MDDYIQQRTENNAGLIYKADFYPIYTQRLGKWLSAEEMIILSFIYYWTKNWNYIYATNEDLAELAGIKLRTAIKLVKRLADLWYIEVVSKTIVWMGTDRRMKYTWKIDGGAKNALPLECASNAESDGGAKNALPMISRSKAKSTGGAKNALPWGKNKFVGETLDNSGKCQENGNPSEVQNLHPYKNIYNRIYFTTKISDEISAVKSTDTQSTELVDNQFMFDDGSIEFYTNSVLQQSKPEDMVEILRKQYPHPVGYKGSKKGCVKPLKNLKLDYDFIYGLIYDMKLLKFQVEYGLVKWPGFMSQYLDWYIPLTENQRDAQLYKIVEYVKRHNQDKSLFEARAKDLVQFLWYEKYRKIFRSIPANREDCVDLSQIK